MHQKAGVGVDFDPVLGHQTGQRGAVFQKQPPLLKLGLVQRQIEGLRDVQTHALCHLWEEVGTGRVEGVVEVEDPSVDIGKGHELRLVALLQRGLYGAGGNCQGRSALFLSP